MTECPLSHHNPYAGESECDDGWIRFYNADVDGWIPCKLCNDLTKKGKKDV